jgi:hypothetical protein
MMTDDEYLRSQQWLWERREGVAVDAAVVAKEKTTKNKGAAVAPLSFWARMWVLMGVGR